MKKFILGASSLACSSLCMAQSAVTIYGVIDAGVTHISNEQGSSETRPADGANYGNRLGFKGEEDLGDGLKGIFTLENGFNLNTGTLGQNSRIFGRQAFVGLSSSTYGALTLGRQYDFVQEYLTELNVGGFASVYAGHQGDFDRISGQQVDNAVKYKSPSWNGWTAGAMYAPEESGTGRTVSAGFGYKKGNLNVGAAYVRLDNTTVYPYLQSGLFSFLGQTTATKDATTGAVTDLYGSGFAVDHQTIGALGASYSLGALTLVGNTSAIRFKADGASSTMHVVETGAIYAFRPQILGIVGYQHDSFESNHWNQLTIGAQYYLSKRTWLYASASWLRTSSGVDASQGAGFYMNPSSTNRQTTSRIAMIHTF